MIAGTSSLQQAGQRLWDAVIVGAGPAGAVVAAEMAKAGAAVLLVDRAVFPRFKVCGCCINKRALTALAVAGLGALPAEAGAVPLHSLVLAAGRNLAHLQLEGGVALSRSALDAALVRAAIGCGAGFLSGTSASLAARQDDRCLIRLQQGNQEGTAAARVVLAADGLGGLLLSRGGIAEAPALPHSRIGAGVAILCDASFYAPGVVYMTVGRAGYLGLVRLEDGLLDLACALDAEAVRTAGGPGGVARALLQGAGWPIPDQLDDQPWRGTAPLTRRARRIAAHRVFALGDATGYVEPFTGEGIAWALTSAVALAPLALRAVQRWQPSLAAEWTKLHRRMVTKRQIACRWTAAVLRRPWLTALVVAILQRAPVLAGPLLRYLAAP